MLTELLRCHAELLSVLLVELVYALLLLPLLARDIDRGVQVEDTAATALKLIFRLLVRVHAIEQQLMPLLICLARFQCVQEVLSRHLHHLVEAIFTGQVFYVLVL